MLSQIATALVSPAFGLISYALVFPYLCIFGKRLHDAGYAAWLWSVFVVGFFILSTVATLILMPLVSPAGYALQQEMQALMADTGGLTQALEYAAEHAEEINRKTLTTNILAFLIASGLTGLVAAGLKSDPAANKYGPPTTA